MPYAIYFLAKATIQKSSELQGQVCFLLEHSEVSCFYTCAAGAAVPAVPLCGAEFRRILKKRGSSIMTNSHPPI